MQKSNIIKRPTKTKLESYRDAEKTYTLNYKKILNEYLPIIEFKVFKIFQETIDKERKVHDFNNNFIRKQVEELIKYCKQRLHAYLLKQFDIFDIRDLDIKYEINELVGSGQPLERLARAGRIEQTYYVRSKQRLYIYIDVNFQNPLELASSYQEKPPSEKEKNHYKITLSYEFELESFLGWH